MLTHPWTRFAWNPWSELHDVQGRMQQLFADLHRASANDLPPINVWSGEHGLRIQAELPGYERDDVEVSVVGDTLTLKGVRKADSVAEDAFHRRERANGRFVRTLELPFRVEADDVKATLANGVLDLELPRAKDERPRRIAIAS